MQPMHDTFLLFYLQHGIWLKNVVHLCPGPCFSPSFSLHHTKYIELFHCGNTGLKTFDIAILYQREISSHFLFCRLQAEQEKLERLGSIAYYSEWVKAWKRDTSREAVEKHFGETGEDEITQLIDMFCHQTDREYRIMMGTDVRIRRDPLAMQMREDQIKQSIHCKAYMLVHFLHLSLFSIPFYNLIST